MREEWEKRRALWEENRKDRLRDIDDCDICNRNGRVFIEGDPEPSYCDHGWGDPPLSSFGIASPVPANPNNIRSLLIPENTLEGKRA
jgi:hypothetical protein